MSENNSKGPGRQVQSVMQPELIKRLTKAAAKEGRSLSSMIARVMEQWVTKKEKP